MVPVEIKGNSIYLAAQEQDPFLLARDVLATSGATLRRMGQRSTTLEDIFLGEAPTND